MLDVNVVRLYVLIHLYVSCESDRVMQGGLWL